MTTDKDKTLPRAFLRPWNVEMKATPFSPYVVISDARTIEDAVQDAAAAKGRLSAYWVRVRPA